MRFDVYGDDFSLNGGRSPDIEKSDVYEQKGHPCILDFMRFDIKIGLTTKRIDKILDKYTSLPEEAKTLIANSFLDDKMKRKYQRIVEERTRRFIRVSE